MLQAFCDLKNGGLPSKEQEQDERPHRMSGECIQHLIDWVGYDPWWKEKVCEHVEMDVAYYLVQKVKYQYPHVVEHSQNKSEGWER